MLDGDRAERESGRDRESVWKSERERERERESLIKTHFYSVWQDHDEGWLSP